jgi:SAM-dependent methyltransferase
VRRSHQDWDDLAAREPYFAVLTEERFLGKLDDERRRDFFATGEADIRQLLELLAERGFEVVPGRALDFGCGVGRLTLPLARRFRSVTGVDVSPRMVEEAAKNLEVEGIASAAFVTRLDDLEGSFEFIVSLIVFQHIPVAEGIRQLRLLLRLLAPGGVAALHFTLGRPGSPLRRSARRLRAWSPALHRMLLRLERSPRDLPYMQMNTYDCREIEKVIASEIGCEPMVIDRSEGEIEGALFVVRRKG